MRTKNSVASYGITLQEAKDYLKVEHTLEDTILSSLVSASYEQICAETNRDFSETSYTDTIRSGSCVFVTSQTVDSISSGSLDNRDDGAYVTFENIYNGPISYTVATGGSVPQNAKVAQLMLVSHWYENRNPYAIGVSATPLGFAVESLLTPFKIVRPY
jgi:hypothetical protein